MTFDCRVELPEWRLHVAHVVRSEGRDLGNVMDVATRGAQKHLSRCFPEDSLDQSRTIVAIRESLRRMNLEPETHPPSSELLISSFIRERGIPRGSLAWEFLAVLVAKSQAPWSVLDRGTLNPPLVFRWGQQGEKLPTKDGELDCEGLPVLVDQTGVKTSPWTRGRSTDLEGCREPVFVCYLPEELFRQIEPKSHLGQVVWLTWAYKFVFERTCSYAPATA